MVKTMKELIKRVVPIRSRDIKRIVYHPLLQDIKKYENDPSINLAIYDASIDALKFPQSALEFVQDLNRGMIADAVPWLSKADTFVPREGIVLDVGAYRGITTQWFSHRAKRVYAFEPMPENILSIRRAIEVRNIQNVEIIDKAVTNRVGESEFYICEVKGHNSLGKVGTSKIVDSIIVETTTIDNFAKIQHIETIDFLKIDVEGFEYEVLNGAEGLLRHHLIRNILFEVSQEPLKSLNKSAGPIYDLLLDNGYSICNLDGDTVNREAILTCSFGDFLAKPNSQ